jgi:hypothetical protein
MGRVAINDDHDTPARECKVGQKIGVPRGALYVETSEMTRGAENDNVEQVAIAERGARWERRESGGRLVIGARGGGGDA